MYMLDWIARLDAFFQFNEEGLHHKGKVTAAIANTFAESDFDRLVASIEEKD